MHEEAFIRRDMDVSFITVDRAEEVIPAIVAADQRRGEAVSSAEVSEKF
jgi:hypothetical protein